MSSPPDPEAPGPAPTRDRFLMAIGAIATAAVLWSHREAPLRAPWLAALVLVSTWLAVIDAREHRLPNRIVGPLAVGVTVVVLAAGWAGGDPGRAGRAIAMGVASSTILLLVNLVGGLGMGDVKYGYPAAASVAWFGADALVFAALVTTIVGGLMAIVILVRGRGWGYRLSYGPFMALGLAAGLFVAGS